MLRQFATNSIADTRAEKSKQHFPQSAAEQEGEGTTCECCGESQSKRRI